jgi:NADPH2:quinone reductase
MKAWVCRAFKDPFEIALEDLPVPEPGAGQVQIRVAAAGLNFGETLVLRGRYQKIPPLPYVPVSEMSGIVTGLGPGVAHHSVGDAVSVFSFSLDGGGLAQYATVPADYAFPKPAPISLVQAAAFPFNYWTAYNGLAERGRIEAGETLLVHGATGGVGVAAIEIGKLLGARVIATGSDDTRLAQVLRLGADHVINLGREDLRARVLELTGGRGADVVLDPVGGDVFTQSMRCIAPGGRLLVVGFTSGKWADARTNLLLVKMISVIGVEGRLAIETTGGRGRRLYEEMLGLIADGRLVPHVGRTYAFEDALTAYDDILSRRHVGKSVLVVDSALCGPAGTNERSREEH